jgi:hypothetical protein
MYGWDVPFVVAAGFCVVGLVVCSQVDPTCGVAIPEVV